MRRKVYQIFLLIWISSVLFDISTAFPSTVSDIAQELTCTCGCNMVASACEGAMTCSAAADIKNQITAMLEKGQTKEEILAYFVSRYGEKILSAPTKSGFNLTAWVLPFVATLLGIGLVYALIKSWTSGKKPEHRRTSFKQEDQAYLERIDRELETFEH